MQEVRQLRAPVGGARVRAAGVSRVHRVTHVQLVDGTLGSGSLKSCPTMATSIWKPHHMPWFSLAIPLMLLSHHHAGHKWLCKKSETRSHLHFFSIKITISLSHRERPEAKGCQVWWQTRNGHQSARTQIQLAGAKVSVAASREARYLQVRHLETTGPAVCLCRTLGV
eukprot:2136821-Pyramimonas_sp.AAC.1